MALIAAHLNAGVILVVTAYSDRYIISLPLPPPLYPIPPFSPSLISLMVSVDVKHHVYLRDSEVGMGGGGGRGRKGVDTPRRQFAGPTCVKGSEKTPFAFAQMRQLWSGRRGKTEGNICSDRDLGPLSSPSAGFS